MAQKKLPTNYEELLKLSLELPKKFWKSQPQKVGEGGKFLGRGGGPPGITPPLGQSFKKSLWVLIKLRTIQKLRLD